MKLEESLVGEWWKVQTTVNGLTATGFVKKECLSPADEVAPPDAPQRVAAVHLPTGGLSVTRANARHAYPLTEVSPVIRNQNDGPAEKVAALREFIEWLDVESSPRYLSRGRTTFCNIYAYDYCYLAKAYLPTSGGRSSRYSDLRLGKAYSSVGRFPLRSSRAML